MGAILAGHYHVVKPLGGGGFGQTYLARDSHLPGQPLCVVKQFKPRLNASKSLQVAKRLFDLEAEILYRLGNHEQIPRLLAHFEQEGEFYLVQEYIEGWPLEQELDRRQRLNEIEVVELLRDVLQVLSFVHQQKVIHRDIKPSNLIRRKLDRRIVLIDFGAVKQVSAQHVTGSGQSSLTVAIGSPGYMPAEQQSSMPQFSSDIYAVGMVALQALTGIDPQNLPKEQDSGEFSCVQLGISPQLAVILDTMVRYDYRQRYPDADAALRAVMALHDSSLTAVSENTTVLPPAGETTTCVRPVAADTHDQDETTLPDLPASLVRSIASARSHLPPTPSDRLSNRSSTGTPVPPAALSRQEYRNRQALLSKVKHYWVKGVLETSLHDHILIVLGLENRPDAVTSPWNLSWQPSQQTEHTLPPGTPLLAIFDQLGTGRTLLILGEPGAGKTTTLLQLTQDLIDRAEQDPEQLIPVVLNLSSWSGATPKIADWVVEELNKKYQVPRKIAHPWVEQQQILLLLDGLDEVRIEQREACVEALNTFQQQYSTEMVVCSRLKDYEALSNRLSFQSAIYLRSLTSAQISYYLDSLNTDLSGLKKLLVEDSALRELARSPLMLNMMVLAYQGVAAEDVSEVMVVEERRRQLFNAYIQRMLQQRQDEQYSASQAIGWLSWLAKQLIHQSQSVFLIEQIQPTWLQTPNQKRLYRIGVALSGVLMGVPFGIITGSLTNGIMDGWRSGLIKGLMNAVIFGVAFGLIVSFSKTEIETVETLKWSWREAKRSLGIGLKNGIPIGLAAGFVFGLLSELNPTVTPSQVSEQMSNGMFLGLLGGICSGIVGGLIYGLAHGLRGSTIETKTTPNQGIWRTIKSAGLGGLMGGWIDAAVIIGVYGGIFGWKIGLLYGLTYGFFGGFIAGFIFGGGQACLKHLVLRLILHRGGYMPWNYAQFLNYAAERAFLQRVGGGYIFIHRLLLEHFAHTRS
jgi:serine/threonine protein kinase